MSLRPERWCVSLDGEGRVKKIDAELKERLAPFGASRSARFRFAYELAFALVCWDRTDATLQAVLAAFQEANGIKSSYQFPALLSPRTAGEEGLAPGNVLSPFHKFSLRQLGVLDAGMGAWGSSDLRRTHVLRSVA